MIKNNKRTTLLFSLICFLLFIGMIELILRTTHVFNASITCSEPDPVLSWRPAPHCNYWYNKENDHPITGKYNSYGWRDQERTINKLPNTYRIAILGDSYVEATQVELDRTFLALTEYRLHKRNGIKAEILNFGRSAFTQTEELYILKNDVAKFSPDIVVLFFLPWNDIQDVRRETAPGLMRPFYDILDSGELSLDTSFTEMSGFKNRLLINRIKRNSALVSFILKRYIAYMANKKLRDKETDSQLNQLDGHLSLYTKNPDPKYLRSYAMNKILIKAMAEYCHKRGIHFVLVTINNKAYIPSIEIEYKLIDPSFNANFFEDDLGSYSKLLNIDYLGLQRTFRQSYLNTDTVLHWGHWNYQGHQVVAEVLTNKLEQLFVQMDKKKN